MTATLTQGFVVRFSEACQQLGYTSELKAATDLKVSDLVLGVDYIEPEDGETLFTNEGAIKFALIASTEEAEHIRRQLQRTSLALPEAESVQPPDVSCQQLGWIDLTETPFVVYFSAENWISKQEVKVIFRTREFARRHPEYPNQTLFYSYSGWIVQAQQQFDVRHTSVWLCVKNYGDSQNISVSQLQEYGLIETTPGDRLAPAIRNAAIQYAKWYATQDCLHFKGTAKCELVYPTEKAQQLLIEYRTFMKAFKEGLI